VIAAVVVGAVLLPAGLAACGSTSASRPSDVRSSLTSLLKPGENPAAEKLTGRRRGGTLTVYSANDFDSLDPGESYYVLDYAVDYATQRPLFSYMPNNASTVVPDMAAFMPTIANGGITDGGRTVTVHIRTGVRFSPPVNRAVTSADIAYAIERGANPNVANPYFAPYFGSDATSPLEGAQDQEYKGGPIPGIQTPNGSTIVFHMTKPGATLLIQALSLPLSAPVPESFARPLDRHKPTTYGSTYLAATGPYMLKSDPSGRFVGIGYQLGRSATLVRNPNWDPSTDYRPAYLNRINIEIGESTTAIGEQVLKGSDAVELDAPAQSIVKLAYASYPSEITFTPGQGDYYMALDNAAGPTRNVNVRRAVWAALDREAIVAARGGPLLAAPMTHFIYPGVIGYAQAGGAAGPEVDYNAHARGSLTVAEKYMRLAGYPSGRYAGKATIKIVGTDTGDDPAVLEIVNRAFTELGFHTHVFETDEHTMNDYCGAPKYEVAACPSVGWVRDFADPEALLYVPFYGPGITPTNNPNWGQVNDPQINSAMARAALVVGVNARAWAWANVDRLLVAEAGAVPETFSSQAEIESANVAGVNAIWNDGIWDFDFTSLR
jgi:peptide/nickel transport system substrate-binding protein